MIQGEPWCSKADVTQISSINKYRIIAQLGRGGMADVYLAVTQGASGFSKLLVVKVLKESLADDADFLAMFADEARLAARLNHPNIVQTYEVGSADNRHYIAMEYLEGQPLHRVMDRLGKCGGLTAELCLVIVCDALAGLHYAHELRSFEGRHLDIVHRDITPQNLFLTYEGQTKLVDFGIAKAFDSTTHTQMGMVKGKIAYMAPEQARGEAVTRAADIFSVGVLLWEMLAQRRLWEGLTDIAIVGRLVQGVVPDLRRFEPRLPAALCELVMKTLSPDPSERPQTAFALQRSLEAILPHMSELRARHQLQSGMNEQFKLERQRMNRLISSRLEAPVADLRHPQSSQRTIPPQEDEVDLAPQSVHDAVTAIHSSVGPLSPGSSQSSTAQSVAATTSHFKRSRLPRAFHWLLTMVVVGGAGLVLGSIQPWNQPQPIAAQPDNGKASEGSKTQATGHANKSPLSPERAAHDDARSSSSSCSSLNKPLVEISGELSDDAELRCENDYLLRFSTYVSPGTTLSIQPGTRLLGDLDTRGTLIVQPGGRIHAAGTPESPIVFSSAAPQGAKKPGDWGGLIILGNAPLNLTDERGLLKRGRIEGLTAGGEYGGDDILDSSGVLSYVRIEYSGTELGPNNEINGLTLGAVGRGTVLHHVQVRYTTDDCFEFFGGTVDGKYLVCQAPGDDAFDWDLGYQGRLQFLVAQADPRVKSGSNGLEGDNDPNGSKNRPVSAPLIYNVTLCGKNRRMYDKEHYGMLLRRGSEVRLRNAIFQGFGAALDVRDAGTKPNIAASLFYQNLVDNFAFTESSAASRSDKEYFDDDNGFDEQLYLKNPGLKIVERDPQLSNCFDQHNPGFKPRYPLLEGAAIPPSDGFFDPNAQYLGAFRDQNDAWDQGAWLAWGPEQ